jgi:hypothetical protein
MKRAMGAHSAIDVQAISLEQERNNVAGPQKELRSAHSHSEG